MSNRINRQQAYNLVRDFLRLYPHKNGIAASIDMQKKWGIALDAHLFDSEMRQ